MPSNDEFGISPPLSFSALLDAIPVPVFYKNLKGQYLGCNRAFEEFFGCRRSDLVGTIAFPIASDGQDNRCGSEEDASRLEEEVGRFKRRVSNAEGRMCDVVINKAVLKDKHGRPEGMIGVLLDITEHNRSERELKKALDFAEGVISAIPDILLSDRARAVGTALPTQGSTGLRCSGR